MHHKVMTIQSPLYQENATRRKERRRNKETIEMCFVNSVWKQTTLWHERWL